MVLAWTAGRSGVAGDHEGHWWAMQRAPDRNGFSQRIKAFDPVAGSMFTESEAAAARLMPS